MGTGKVTVEHLGLKDCPRCDGQGNIESQPQDPLGQPPQDPNGAPPQQNGGEQPQQNGEQTYTEPSEDGGQSVQNLQEPQEEQPLQQNQDMDQSQQSQLERPFEQEALKKSSCKVCPKSIKQFEGFIKRKIDILQNKQRGKRRAGEGVGLLFGLPTISRKGKKIKGVLAYAGVSLNNRIYLPEELAKGDGMTLPLLLNHSNVAGAEEELDRLEDDMRGSLENGKDFKIGEVTLRWEPEELTLYYEGVIEHPFFQKEVDDANMAVSLGIWYDSDSPQVCDVECYTLIRGAEFREVSLVYHPGFPIATIEAVEARLKYNARKQISTESYARHIERAIEAEEQRTYKLQPKMSLPKTTGELNIPKNPEVMKPEDTMKDKDKADEDNVKKKLMKNSRRKSIQEKRLASSQLRGVLHNLS